MNIMYIIRIYLYRKDRQQHAIKYLRLTFVQVRSVARRLHFSIVNHKNYIV